MRMPDSVIVVDNWTACCSNQFISSLESPVRASTSAFASSRLFRCSRSWLSFIETPVIAAMTVPIRPIYLLMNPEARDQTLPCAPTSTRMAACALERASVTRRFCSRAAVYCFVPGTALRSSFRTRDWTARSSL